MRQFGKKNKRSISILNQRFVITDIKSALLSDFLTLEKGLVDKLAVLLGDKHAEYLLSVPVAIEVNEARG